MKIKTQSELISNTHKINFQIQNNFIIFNHYKSLKTIRNMETLNLKQETLEVLINAVWDFKDRIFLCGHVYEYYDEYKLLFCCVEDRTRLIQIYNIYFKNYLNDVYKQIYLETILLAHEKNVEKHCYF